MTLTQAVERPFGINVFGSSTVKVEPDMASLQFAVTRLGQNPRDAFREAREGVRSVQAFLAQAKMTDVSSSRITLSQTFRWAEREQHFVGYTAKVGFHVLLRELDRMEELLTGVVEAGANEVIAVELQTTRLKELRAEVRGRAVEAAKEKAENYAKAAGIQLGPIIHIEDVNPEWLQGRGMHTLGNQPEAEAPLNAFDPGSITVEGAVMVSYAIGR